MDKQTSGAWIIHHTNKLNQWTRTGEFENLEFAGKAGILLSALSATDESTLSQAKVTAIAKAAGLHSEFETPRLLEVLRRQRLIDTTPQAIAVLGLTTAATLQHTHSIFELRSPSKAEIAAIDLAERTSESPVTDSEIKEQLQDSFKLSLSETSRLLEQYTSIGFVDCESLDATTRLIFNGNLFKRENATKIKAVLSSLSETEIRKTVELNQLLHLEGCIEASKARTILGSSLLEKLHSIGAYDVSEVANPNESTAYITRPSAFGKFGNPFADDALDLAKALVACLKYGMTRSPAGRGRIVMLEALMRKLLAGLEVGPATAIGEDYQYLEFKRVVSIRPDGKLYWMRLLKRDIGELALAVLTEGDASAESLENLPSAAANKYAPPERTRELKRKLQSDSSKHATAELLLSIRSGEGGRDGL